MFDLSTAKDDAIVLQMAIEKRKDAPGIYKLKDPIQVLDETEDRQLVATIKNVKLKDEIDIKRDFTDSSWILIDMKVENKGKQEINANEAFPDTIIEDRVNRAVGSDFFEVDDYVIGTNTR